MNSSPVQFLSALGRIAAAALALAGPAVGLAQTPAQAPVQNPPTSSGASVLPPAGARAAWLDRLTLGSGDLLNLTLLGSPELSKAGVPIGPDGRIGFLEAQDVMASGLTIDELRQRLDEELGKFRRAPRMIVTPAGFQSKKYFVLGQVVGQGVFTLDRPITVIEAVARARGLTLTSSRGRMTEVADLSHSFLVRQGKRMDVDFEQLFLRGDLAQNTFIEPGDYLYFPPAQDNGIYVLGEVRQAGITPFAVGATAVSAITTRGGFSDRAWKRRILIVRGSLDHPTTFVIDIADVLAAKTPDFALQPRDIVYVGARPWIRAEELLDAAASAFVQAAVIVWTGETVYNTVR